MAACRHLIKLKWMTQLAFLYHVSHLWNMEALKIISEYMNILQNKSVEFLNPVAAGIMFFKGPSKWDSLFCPQQNLQLCDSARLMGDGMLQAGHFIIMFCHRPAYFTTILIQKQNMIWKVITKWKLLTSNSINQQHKKGRSKYNSLMHIHTKYSIKTTRNKRAHSCNQNNHSINTPR